MLGKVWKVERGNILRKYIGRSKKVKKRKSLRLDKKKNLREKEEGKFWEKFGK